MALNVGQLFASLQLNTQQFFNGLNRAQLGLAKLAKTMLALGTKMSLGISGPLSLLGYKAIKAASDLNENFNKVNEVFKENAKVVQDWSKGTLKNIGLAQSSALDMASLFGDMGTSMGIPTDAASKMSMSLVELGGDMASFKNIGFDEVQTALNGIFTGETESLKRLGIVMTETNLIEFARSKGITTSLNKMDQASKVNLRYAFVMDKTKNAQGDFARTSAGAANQTRVFGESLKELSASFGQVMLPFFTRVITKINDMIQAFAKLRPETKEAIIKWALFAIVLGPVLVVLGSIASAVSSLMGLMSTLSAITLAGTASFLGWTAVVISAVLAATLLGLAAVVVKENWEKLKAYFISFGVFTAILFKTIADGISLLFNVAIEKIISDIKRVAGMVPGLKMLLNDAEKPKTTITKPPLLGPDGLFKSPTIFDYKVTKPKTALDMQAERFNNDLKALIVSAKLTKKLEEEAKQGMLDTATDIYDELGTMFSLDNLLSVDSISGSGLGQKLKESTDELLKSLKDGLSGLGDGTDKIKGQMDDLISKVRQLADAFRTSLGGLFDKVQPSKRISAKKLVVLENMKVKMMEEFKATMEAIGAKIGFGSELFNEFMQIGPSGNKSLKGLLGNESQLMQLNSAFGKRSELAWQLGGMQAQGQVRSDAILQNMSVNLNGGVYVGNMFELANMIVKELKAKSVG